MNVPTLHLGGTSYEELMRQHSEAIEKLQSAREALVDACPHPRDFIRRDIGYRNALQMHSARVGLLNEMIKELDRIREGIQSQQDERERQRGR